MKLTLLILSLFVCLDLTAQKENYFLSKWRNNPDEDLQLAMPDYVSAKKGKVLYYLSNDEVNIYVDMKILETLEENRILKMGLTVWIDMDGKTRKVMGIRYPIGSQFSRPRGQNSFANAGTSATPLSLANSIELIGFKDVESTRFPSNNPGDIRGAVKYDQEGELIYRLVIPLSRLPLRNNTEGKGLMPFALGIEYGAPPTFAGQRGGGGMQGSSGGGSPMNGGGGGSRGGGGGGSRGGGGGMGAPGGGAPSGGPAIDPPVIFWMKNVKLAEKN